MKRMILQFPARLSLVVAAMVALLSSGCTSYSTESTEVGIRTRKIFSAGIEEHVYPPGATYFFVPFLSDWTTFDIKLQNLEMVAAAAKGDRVGDDALEFKTTDGNDIRVNVTVAWRVNQEQVTHLLRKVGRSTTDVKEKLVRPACRTYVRDILNELHSEEFYVSEKRFQKAQKALAKLQAELGPEGVIVEQVLLGEQSFNPEYQKVIHDRKLAEQNAERLKSEAQAAEADAQSKLEKAKGDVQAALAKAKGDAEQLRISADRVYYENEREAKAILVEASSKAKAIEKQNKAMSGAGGRTAVKLRIAAALQGKPIVMIPSGGGAAIQKLDVNRLVDSIMAQEATKPTRRASKDSDENDDD